MEKSAISIKKERDFPILDLLDQSNQNAVTQPLLVVQSPKTPTLSKKLKAISLDSDPPAENSDLDISRDVFSMPNTPKRQIKPRLSCDFEDDQNKFMLTPNFNTNLKKFASNTSISGSQTLKTLPEIMTLQDFSDCPLTAPIKIKAKGLLERRGSNASLTIDLGSNSSIAEQKPSFPRLNTAKSVSNLTLSTFDVPEKSCHCLSKCEAQKVADRRKSQEACGNCTIYESVPVKMSTCQKKCHTLNKCSCCIKSRRKSLSNENLYVPPCGFCQTGAPKDCLGNSKQCKGYRKACYPRQPDLESSQLLSDDFKLHLQNIQYLQTAGNILTIDDLKQSCEVSRVPKLHQEFWEVPLNLQEKCYVSGSQNRNRYRGVLPNEHSRVHLVGTQPYIHANYIKGPDYTETAYIATQGPMSHTCQDFWEMVWSTHCKCIVMLTNLVEKGRNKCELYFPLGKPEGRPDRSFFFIKTTKVRDKFTFDRISNTQQYDEEIHSFEEVNEITFGNFQISYVDVESIGDCQLRRLSLRKTDADARMIYHYWFSNWPDHKMADPQQVLDIALDVLNKMEMNKNDKNSDVSPPNNTKRNTNKKSKLQNPVTVHCSAGIGRTGCFLSILNGLQQLIANEDVDVLAILCSLRLNRGGMVQTAEQYELIHRVLSLYADRRQ